ncbi:hypothetical protein H0H93_008001 [Arthromyces matolae]|nr:hypothetical protein H0H93_008001 [Arthromyces matolae]
MPRAPRNATAVTDYPGGPDNVPRAVASALRRRGIIPSKGKKKDVSDPYKLKKGDLPDDIGGLKTAMEVHIRILWNVLSQTAIPLLPDPNVLANFALRYTDAEALRKLLNDSTTAARNRATDRMVLTAVQQVRQRCVSERSSIISTISRVPDNALHIIFTAVHSAGLTVWRPDVLGGTPTSPYNGSLEAIALWSFQQAAAVFAYSHLMPNLKYLEDFALLRRIYLNFVFSYLRKKIVKEKRVPGTAEKEAQDNKVYKLRSDLTDRRYTYLKEHG